MKELIKTCDFWAETWALSTLETILLRMAMDLEMVGMMMVAMMIGMNGMSGKKSI